MRFSVSGEVDGPIAESFITIANFFRREVESRLDEPQLKKIDCEICYIPIVMRDDPHSCYPARTRVSRKERTLYACPKLDFTAFSHGDKVSALREYANGLRGELPRLAELPLSPEQVLEICLLIEAVEAKLVSTAS